MDPGRACYQDPTWFLTSSPSCSRPAVLKGEQCNPRRYLETFLVVTVREESAAGVLWVEAGDAASAPALCRLPPTESVTQPQISVGPKWRNPALD